MPVSKRTRFEVLRRDSHTCQYCGQMAPDVVLHIDHVEPTALGGSDKPDNLVTACKDCNLGKASIAPDSPLVAGLSAKAAAYALGMTDKMTRLRGAMQEGGDYCEDFKSHWNSYTYNATGKTIPMPGDWESSVQRWFEMGIPARVLDLAADKAMVVKNLRGDYPEFAYMCGIVWNRINDAQIDYSLTDETVKVYTEYEADERAIEAYEIGAGLRSNSEALVDSEPF